MSTYATIEEIKQANAAIGHFWFSPETMEWFQSEIHPRVYHGRFFITSEQGKHGEWDGARRFTVRECIDGSIHTVSEFGEFDTWKEAQMFARQVGAYHEALG